MLLLVYEWDILVFSLIGYCCLHNVWWITIEFLIHYVIHMLHAFFHICKVLLLITGIRLFCWVGVWCIVCTILPAPSNFRGVNL